MDKSPIAGPYYEVRVADNSRYMDKEAECSGGIFFTSSEAIQKCKLIVDSCLEECAGDTKSPAEIFACYQYFGDDPYLMACNGAPTVTFSAWDYAEKRARDFAQESAADL